ncbi:MAG: serine hydrolase, partial [Hyphomicrobiales bacterium]
MSKNLSNFTSRQTGSWAGAVAAVAIAFFVAALSLKGASAADEPEPFASKAPFAILVNYDTGTVLYEKDADKPFPPASLAKLMTMAVVFDALEAGTASLDQEYVVSEHAWRTGGGPSGGSAMFVELGSSVRLGDLVQGVIVQSGNDAAI